MIQQHLLSFVGVLFWLLSFSATYGSTIVAPQAFTDEVDTCCRSNEFDRFLGWIQEIDLLSMNRVFKETTPFAIPSIIHGFEADYYTRWKEEYYARFRNINQTKSFLLAGEFYPAIQLLQSTALSFYELPPVIRTCIMFSGKMGNPIAENILMLADIDNGLEAILERAGIDDAAMFSLLQTPFVWNNIEAMNFLKDPSRYPRVLSLVNGENPFVYLNGYFLLTELNLEATVDTSWLERAKILGSGLAALRLHQRDLLIDFTNVPPTTVRGSIAIHNAYRFRYETTEEAPNRTQARVFYEEALTYEPTDPFLHLEIADFYKDLYSAEVPHEVELEETAIIEKTLFHYKEAHIRGDGDAALETIKFVSYLQEKEVAIPTPNAWELPAADIQEALTLLYEAAYHRREEPIFLTNIKKLGRRTEATIKAFELKVIRNLNHRRSIIRFGV